MPKTVVVCRPYNSVPEITPKHILGVILTNIEMDLTQQVKNSYATETFASTKKKPFKGQSKPAREHQDSLQALANGNNPPYEATLRMVKHEGSKAPFRVPQPTRKPSCYCRNENGGYFTS
uniref:Uncharacterized protein n=1 Tax=Tetraselmis sp. GSL018 TaxID=582737 RepID=A0A061S7P1_9CHLO